MKQVFAREMGIALDQLQTKYALRREENAKHVVQLKNISFMFAERKESGIHCADRLYGDAGEIVANYAPSAMPIGNNEIQLPVFTDASRKTEVFALTARCEDASRAVVQAVCCVLVRE